MSNDHARIPSLPREAWTEEARDVFAFWGEPNAREVGSKTNVIMALAQHPKLAMAYNIFGKHLLIDTTLPARPRELIILRVAWHLKSDYEWHYHVGYAINIGMTLDEIAAIRTGPAAENWSAQDRAVLSAVDEILQTNTISDAIWAALSAHFDRHQLMDLVLTIGSYVMTSWAIASFGIALEDNVDKIGFDLKTNSGKVPGATFRPGESEDWASKSGLNG